MTIHSDLALLNPKFSLVATRLHEYLIDAHETRRTKTRFEVFETYRDPIRQAQLRKNGASKAGPFQSAHQFGLAVDFVPYLTSEEAIALGTLIGERINPGWSWHSSHDYKFLLDSARKFNLAMPVFAWDKCHVEHPNFGKLRAEFRKHVE